MKLFNYYKVFVAILALFIGISSFAAPKVTLSETESANFCPDPTFSNASQWNRGSEYKTDPGRGMNGNTALLVQRTNPQSYALLTKKINGLKPETTYVFGVWAKGENIKTTMKGMDKRGGTVCIEFYYKNKYMSGGSYPLGVYGTKDWTLIQGKVTTPAKFDKATIAFYLGKYTVGKAWFYSPYIHKDAPQWKVGLLCPVMNYAIKPETHNFIFSSFIYGLDSDSFKVNVEVITNDKVEQTFVAPIKNNRIKISTKLNPGKYTFKLSLVDKKSNKRSLEKNVSAQVLDPEASRPGNAVFIDNRGRAWVDGKKFMPIGLYTNQQSSAFKQWSNRWRHIDTKNLKNSPFNCIMPYDITTWRLEGSNTTGTAAPLEVMDELNRNDIKVIFSVKDIKYKWNKWHGATGMDAVITKIVETYRNHPALLAWYVNDEQGVEALDINKRELISSLDPFHPTWQVQCIYYRFKDYQGASDVFGVDPYPIADGVHDMELVRKNMNLAMEAVGFDNRIALWAVPQIFPWSQHRGFEKTCWPTEKQIRSMSLLMAIMGAKGFVMYSYTNLFTGKEPGFEKHWPGICNAAQTLRDISPFILGDPQAPELQVKTAKGKIMAKAFTADNGKTCVLIAAIGPGEAEATITVKGNGNFKSRYGRSTLNSNGSWTFKGHDIDCDVLFPAN